jgi:NADPH:quinone reductase-like Zn-dependent oxidoreductase
MQPFARSLIDGKTPGFDFAGVVVDAPPGSPYKGGDAVFGTVPSFAGALQEYVLAPVDQIAPKPPRITFDEAAGLPLVGITALQGQSRGSLPFPSCVVNCHFQSLR